MRPFITSVMVMHDSLETCRHFHCRKLSATQMNKMLLHVGMLRIVPEVNHTGTHVFPNVNKIHKFVI
jgi:hypothetical protein